MLFGMLPLGALLLLVSVVPAPAFGVRMLPPPQNIFRGYNLSVTNWNAKCEKDTKCSYGFDVAGDAFGPKPTRVPPFDAFCESNTGEGGEYVGCTLKYSGIGERKLVTKLLPRDPDERIPDAVNLVVSYAFTSQDEINTSWNVTGKTLAPFNKAPRNFKIDITSNQKSDGK